MRGARWQMDYGHNKYFGATFDAATSKYELEWGLKMLIIVARGATATFNAIHMQGMWDLVPLN